MDGTVRCLSAVDTDHRDDISSPIAVNPAEHRTAQSACAPLQHLAAQLVLFDVRFDA
jgi:hypothetical protein